MKKYQLIQGPNKNTHTEEQREASYFSKEERRANNIASRKAML